MLGLRNAINLCPLAVSDFRTTRFFAGFPMSARRLATTSTAARIFRRDTVPDCPSDLMTRFAMEPCLRDTTKNNHEARSGRYQRKPGDQGLAGHLALILQPAHERAQQRNEILPVEFRDGELMWVCNAVPP